MISTLSVKYIHRFLILLLIFVIVFSFTNFAFAENNSVIIEFYYADGCDHCEEKIPIIDEIEEHYKGNVSIIRYSIEIYENRQKFFQYSFNTTPGVVVKNETSGKYSIFPYEIITFENIINSTDYYLAGNDSIKPPVPTKNTTFCFLGFCFDVSKLSLPVLTVAMAFLDSFNPCAFFILIFLLNLLIYVRSRRRMLLIGGIFIFFSAFIYFLLMSAILNVIIFVEQQFFIRVIAGSFALVFGILNIKDFFLFKKGISLSISDEKKSDLFKRMRKIVITPFLPAMIVGTIVLAIFANTYELLCSLGLPIGLYR
jgi:thiol-disulfide isomerase/thioredoxin